MRLKEYLNEAKMTIVMISPNTSKVTKKMEKEVTKAVKDFKGKITDVTDKNSAIAEIPSDKVDRFKRQFGVFGDIRHHDVSIGDAEGRYFD
jgi:hypothetical protein